MNAHTPRRIVSHGNGILQKKFSPGNGAACGRRSLRAAVATAKFFKALLCPLPFQYPKLEGE
jgi:hypothetical protein